MVLVILCGIFISSSVKSQHKIEFSYDNSGNMTERKVINLKSLQQPTEEDNLSNNKSEDKENTNDNPTDKNVYQDLIDDKNIKIYPNPTRGELIVDISNYTGNTNDRIDIYDLRGTLKKRVSPVKSSNTIYITSYPSGTYIMVIQVNGVSVQWKIIKQ